LNKPLMQTPERFHRRLGYQRQPSAFALAVRLQGEIISPDGGYRFNSPGGGCLAYLKALYDAGCAWEPPAIRRG
jgi:hypothetical protein